MSGRVQVRDDRATAQLWVVPPFDGPPTGGTRYGTALVAALLAHGVACRRLDVEQALAALARGDPGTYWIDSLYLDRLPALRAARARPDACRLVLVAHYLPAMVAHGEAMRAEHLSSQERDALASADAILATSTTMARVLAPLAPRGPIACVEPGVDVTPARAPLADPPRALVLANVTEGKGILPLLHGLAAHATACDGFSLHVVGSLDREPTYAAACATLVERDSFLRERVRFTGSLPHGEAMRELAAADVLVSASRMESYGIALAEARAAGVPILARAGGHVAAHLAAEAGGELVHDPTTLAPRLLALVRAPAELAQRKRLALAHTRARSWQDAARDFLAAWPTLRAANDGPPR